MSSPAFKTFKTFPPGQVTIEKGLNLFDRIVDFGNFSFKFQTFYHAHVRDFISILNRGGVDELLQRSVEELGDTMDFNGNYSPNINGDFFTTTPYPDSAVDFATDGAYSCYNWELFFHIPMLIACRLSADQRYEDARRWFHKIFDPTNTKIDPADATNPKKRFWQFKPFYDEANNTIETLDQLLKNTAELQAQIPDWQDNPFDPHRIARLRISAYMKSVVMKYIDNLIAWGDQLFRMDTMESVSEATLLYVLSYQILGDRPEQVPARATHGDYSFDDILALAPGKTIDEFSNIMVDIETILTASPPPGSGSSWSAGALGTMFYFGVPRNQNLLQYWDTVEDRLFKIRNSMNIEGVVRTLPLFQPPIDPLVLVRAFAAGMDLSSILADLSAPLPSYRFTFMIQKAHELCNEVKSLGSSLLQALEKRDAEALALLRSANEQQLLKAVLAIKQQQVEDAQAVIDSTTKSLENAMAKNAYYSSRPFTNTYEQQHLNSLQTGLLLTITQNEIELIGSILAEIPDLKIGAPTSIGATYGGTNLSTVMRAISQSIGILSTVNNSQGVMASTLGGYTRRMDDWKFQADSSKKEIEQIEKQLLSAQIKLSVAQKDLDNQQMQIDNAQAVDDFMRNKFTNQDLYDWMVGQLATVYFQSYQLAYDLAKKAEQCYRFEIDADRDLPSFIQFGYWDSLKKGLLSGERLQYDLRKMEAAYADNNKRQFEITKHVSLAMLNADALLDLQATGACKWDVPEILFEMDFPGHYCRRIKSISLSIPCIAGPYTSVSAQLNLADSYIRTLDQNGKISLTSDLSFTRVDPSRINSNAIATSNAQADPAMFELNFRDERYMPFEGAGVVSSWMLELPTAVRQFDYNTISDVIMTVRYTAKDSTTGPFKGDVHDKVQKSIASVIANINNKAGFYRLISLKHDYPSDFYKMQTGTATSYDLTIPASSFAFFTRKLTISLKTPIQFYDRGSLVDNTGARQQTAMVTASNANNEVIDEPWVLHLQFAVQDIQKATDILVLLNYTLN